MAKVVKGGRQFGFTALTVVGDGNGKPTGIVPGAGLGHTTAAGLTSGFAWDDLTDLEQS